MNRHQKAIVKYTKSNLKFLEDRFNVVESFVLVRKWVRDDLVDMFGKLPSVETINRMIELDKASRQ